MNIIINIHVIHHASIHTLYAMHNVIYVYPINRRPVVDILQKASYMVHSMSGSRRLVCSFGRFVPRARGCDSSPHCPVSSFLPPMPD